MAPGEMISCPDHKSEAVEVLDFWVSPYGMRVKLALAAKGVAYTIIPEKLMGAPRSPLLLQSNPVYKKVPVLLHHGNPICESLIICEYVDQAFSTCNNKVHLLPQDPYRRAKARFWADFADKKVLDSLLKLLRVPREELGAVIQDIKEHLRTFEKGAFSQEEFGAGPFFGGVEVGFVDVVIGPLVVVLPALQSLLTNYTKQEEDEDIFEVGKLPRLQAWLKAFGELPLAHNIDLPTPAKLADGMKGIRKMRFPHEN